MPEQSMSMPSIARHHFPIIRWQDGKRHLWNPIHRKILKNRPEERVRLRVIEFLLEAGWSRYRITTEEALKGNARGELRTDLICYNQEFEPRILIECKAENVTVSKKAAEQIARYNRYIQAPYLLLSNGYKDYWYRISRESRSIQPLSGIPGILKPPESLPERSFDYWRDRGFAGGKAVSPLRRWLEQALLHVLCSGAEFRYLQFKQSPSGTDLNHYYIVDESGDYKVAHSLANTPYGGSRIIGIINREGENVAVVEINLDLVFDDEQPNASVYSKAGVRNMDVRDELSGLLYEMDSRSFETLPAIFKRLFEENH